MRLARVEFATVVVIQLNGAERLVLRELVALSDLDYVGPVAVTLGCDKLVDGLHGVSIASVPMSTRGVGTMNEKLEAFRKRLHGSEREHSDELSVVLDEPSVHLSRSQDKVEVASPRSITFINSGSRPIAVTGVVLNVMQPHEYELKPTCKHNYSQNIPFAFEQTVVKPYDMASRPLKFADKETFSTDITFENRGMNTLSVCAIFQLAAHDEARWQKTMSLGLYRVQVSGVDDWKSDKEKLSPAYLIKRNRFWTAVNKDKYFEAPDE